MAGFVIGTLEITDPAPLEEYNTKVFAVIERFGGTVIASGPVVTTLEGDAHPDLAVVIAFDSADEATRWYESAEYGAIRGLRQGSGRAGVWLVNGLPGS